MPKTVKSVKVSKRSVIVGLMTSNKDKSMDEVVKLIVSSTAFVHHARPDEEARYYYGKFVRTGVAPGTFVRVTKKVKAAAVKPAKPKAAPAVVQKVQSVPVKPATAETAESDASDLSFLSSKPEVVSESVA